MADKVINNLQLSVASMNGDFSVSTNDSLARALFKMGLTVSTKRIYPSNIKGAPTRYLIRISSKGYQGLQDKLDLALLLFEENAADELSDVKNGGVAIYDSSTKNGEKIDEARENKNTNSPYFRKDIIYYGIPFRRLSRDNFQKSTIQKIMRNVIYVGALAELLNLQLKPIKSVLEENFCEKGDKIVSCNLEALELGSDYVREQVEKRDPYLIEPPQTDDNRLFMSGNDATALGTIMGGCTYASWYPITPATSHGENLERYSQKFPIIVEQGENEDSCLGRALGAAWAGARASVSSSGPGLSNMAEFIGYSSFAEIPIVIFDVQRVGPATGKPTHTKQGDLRYLLHASHDESPRIILTPGNIEQLYEYSILAFNLADKYQMPVIVVSELILGECYYTTDKFSYPDREIDRGKMLSDEELDELEKFQRYRDVDNDGICPRTIPGQEATYVTRGAYHDEEAQLSEAAKDCQKKIERLYKKMETLRRSNDLPEPEIKGPRAECPGIIAFGSSIYTVEEAQDKLARENIRSALFNLPSIAPLPREELETFITNHRPIFIVEQNYTAQLRSLLEEKLKVDNLISIKKYDGNPMQPKDVIYKIKEHLS
ncbi:MAG: 2-oxoacid:acceptor oxidoreductase subunit alpha [bacterium]